MPFYRCFINSPSPRNRNLSHYKLHSSSTTKQIDVGLFNLGGYHLADEEMTDKADLPEVLRVLVVLLRRLSEAHFPSVLKWNWPIENTGDLVCKGIESPSARVHGRSLSYT